MRNIIFRRKLWLCCLVQLMGLVFLNQSLSQDTTPRSTWVEVAKSALVRYLADNKVYPKGLDVCQDGTFALRLSGNKELKKSAVLFAVPLRLLDVSSTPLTELWALAGSATLEELDASSTGLGSVEVCRGFRELRKLDISSTEVKDISPLTNTPLVFLTAIDAPISNLEVVASLRSLAAVNISPRQITPAFEKAMRGRDICINGYHGTNFWGRYDRGEL